jgi:hypothetical protein
MNIMDLEIGQSGLFEGVVYRVIEDRIEHRPGVGKVRVRTAVDQLGFKQKFIRGIEVEPMPLPNGERT